MIFGMAVTRSQRDLSFLVYQRNGLLATLKPHLLDLALINIQGWISVFIGLSKLIKH